MQADRAGIEALVDDAEESQSRMRNVPLLGMVQRRVGGAREMLSLDAAGEAMHVGMPCLFGSVQAGAAGEDDGRRAQQRALEFEQLGGRIHERG